MEIEPSANVSNYQLRVFGVFGPSKPSATETMELNQIQRLIYVHQQNHNRRVFFFAKLNAVRQHCQGFSWLDVTTRETPIVLTKRLDSVGLYLFSFEKVKCALDVGLKVIVWSNYLVGHYSNLLDSSYTRGLGIRLFASLEACDYQ